MSITEAEVERVTNELKKVHISTPSSTELAVTDDAQEGWVFYDQCWYHFITVMARKAGWLGAGHTLCRLGENRCYNQHRDYERPEDCHYHNGWRRDCDF